MAAALPNEKTEFDANQFFLKSEATSFRRSEMDV
jgi:hypothetical protein